MFYKKQLQGGGLLNLDIFGKNQTSYLIVSVVNESEHNLVSHMTFYVVFFDLPYFEFYQHR